MTTEVGAALVDGRLLGRPRSYGGNSQEWNAFKFAFMAYVGVIAPPILTAMDRVEPMTDPVPLSAHSLRQTRTLLGICRSCWRKSCLDHLCSS